MGKQRGYSLTKEKGTWRVRVRDPRLRRYASKTFAIKSDAEAWGREAVHRFQAGVDSARRVRLQELGGAYVLKLEAGGRSKGRIDHVRMVIEKAVDAGLDDLEDEYLPERTVYWLSRLQARRYGQRKGNPASARTKNYYLQTLRSIANHGLKKGLLARNPFLACDPFREEKRRKALFTIDELRCMVDSGHSRHPWWLFTVTVAYTGMRSREARSMAWSWVDWDAGVIRLPAAVSKTNRDRRIPLQPELAAILRPQARVGPLPVFGKHITLVGSNETNKAFQDYLRSIGIEPRREQDHRARSVHCLRHCVACLLTATGVSPFLAMEYLGHEHVATSRHYSVGAVEYASEAANWKQGVFELMAAREMGSHAIA